MQGLMAASVMPPVFFLKSKRPLRGHYWIVHHLVRTRSIPIQQFITTFVSSILSLFFGSNHLVSLLTADAWALFYWVKSKLISKQTCQMITHLVWVEIWGEKVQFKEGTELRRRSIQKFLAFEKIIQQLFLIKKWN